MQITDLTIQRMMRRYITAYMEAAMYQEARDRSIKAGHVEDANYQRCRNAEEMGKYDATLEDLSDITGKRAEEIDSRMHDIVGADNDTAHSYRYAGMLVESLGLFTNV
jgi:hypothetical protein